MARVGREDDGSGGWEDGKGAKGDGEASVDFILTIVGGGIGE